MFYSVTTIGAFTVIFYASSFTNARTRQKAPEESTHFIIYSIVKGEEYYIPNDTKKDRKFKNKTLLNTHAFFRDEKSNKSSKFTQGYSCEGSLGRVLGASGSFCMI